MIAMSRIARNIYPNILNSFWDSLLATSLPTKLSDKVLMFPPKFSVARSFVKSNICIWLVFYYIQRRPAG